MSMIFSSWKEELRSEEGGSMFGPKMGTWDVQSSTDPRWNNGGRNYGFCSAGGPAEMQDWLRSCKENFGEPPEDLTASFMKD